MWGIRNQAWLIGCAAALLFGAGCTRAEQQRCRASDKPSLVADSPHGAYSTEIVGKKQVFP